MDLTGRKVPQDGGAKVGKCGKRVQDFSKANADKPERKEFIEPLMDIGDKVTKLTAELGQMSVKNPDDLGAAAVPYLRVVGHLVYSYLWARMARVALDGEGPDRQSVG